MIILPYEKSKTHFFNHNKYETSKKFSRNTHQVKFVYNFVKMNLSLN